MKIFRYIFVFLLFIPCFIFALKTYQPWYTGPLIASDGSNLAPGFVNVQPYLFFKDTYGEYNKAWGHHSNPSTFTFKAEMYFQTGITKWLDVAIIANSFFKEKEGKTAFDVGDTSVEFGLQLLRGKDLTAIPYVRLIIEEVFPTGKYNNLNPTKEGIDATGSGSYETIFNLIFQKTVFWFTNHPIRWRTNAAYTYSTKVSVKNFNVYGGGFGTRGKVAPGGVITGILAFEFSFNQRWVFAMDTVYVYARKTTFKGTPGLTSEGTAASNSTGSSDTTSLAPVLEYNFNENFGILAGSHFTIRKRNATKFTSGIISATYTF